MDPRRKTQSSQFAPISAVSIDKYYIYYIDIISAHFEPA